jgi:membrane-associated phospholipid phosphatase
VATVYFGWHYVVDDIAGLVIGAAAVALSAALTGHWRVVLRGGRG